MPAVLIDRRRAFGRLLGMFGAAGFARGEEATEALLACVRVMDFAPLAKAKLDPVAWDYLETGSEDEISLRDNREAFTGSSYGRGRSSMCRTSTSR
jgi:hypothetical protein